MKSTLLVSLTAMLTVAAAETLGKNSADVLRDTYDISLGRGLYADFPDVVSLNETSLERALSSGRSWLIEFYNSWCGHCIKFAPTWKKVALDIKGWSDLIQVGAVDCSNPTNTAICRRYEVMAYPTVRYFPPQLPSSDFLGDEMFKRSLDAILAETVKELSQRNDLRDALAVRNQSKIDWSTVPNTVDRIVIVQGDSAVGRELALDLRNVSPIRVVISENVNAEPRVILQSRPGLDQPQFGPVLHRVVQRNAILSHLCTLFCPKGLKIPVPANLSNIQPVNIDVTAAIALKQLAAEIKEKMKKLHAANVVFQVDIEQALQHSLKKEIPLHNVISGETLTALRKYFEVLVKYFHIGENGKRMLECIESQLKGPSITGEAFSNLTRKCENDNNPIYQNTQLGWVGCRGSLPTFRGYPCGMWTHFHALTVQQYLKQTGSPREVLDAITGYVKYFFGCTSCSHHFQEMARTIDGNVTDGASGLLWLWAAHNQVNARLAHDATEDPDFPKIQYPSARDCSNCRFPNDTWNRDKVTEYLVRVYDTFSFMTLEEIDPDTRQDTVQNKALRSEYIVDDVKYSERRIDDTRSVFFTLGFGLFDFSLCLGLYVFSMGIIALVCIKIIKNRKSSYKKKGNLLESFMKV